MKDQFPNINHDYKITRSAVLYMRFLALDQYFAGLCLLIHVIPWTIMMMHVFLFRWFVDVWNVYFDLLLCWVDDLTWMYSIG